MLSVENRPGNTPMNRLVSQPFFICGIPITGCCNRMVYNGRGVIRRSTDCVYATSATGSIIADRVNDRQTPRVPRTIDYGNWDAACRHRSPIVFHHHRRRRRPNRRLMASPSAPCVVKQAGFNRPLPLIVCIMLQLQRRVILLLPIRA